MKRTLRSGAAAVILLVAAGGVAAATTGSGSEEDRTVVLNLVGKEVQSSYLPVRADEVSQGDELHFSNDLYRRLPGPRGGETKVGEDGGLCTVSRAIPNGATSYACVGTNDLPAGQITTQGLVTYGPGEEIKAEPYSFVITGGTGRFRTARGEVSIKELGRAGVRLTFRIVL